MRRRRQKEKLSTKEMLGAIIYSIKYAHKAVGMRGYLGFLGSTVDAIVPTITAILLGLITTGIVEAVSTKNILPVVWYAVAILVMNSLRYFLSLWIELVKDKNIQDTMSYVYKKSAEKYLETPLAVRETKEFADKFERVKDYGNNIDWVMRVMSELIEGLVGVIVAIIAVFWVSPVLVIIVIASTIPYSLLDIKLAKMRQMSWREFTGDRRKSWLIMNKIIESDGALEIKVNGLGKYIIHEMVRTREKSRDYDIKQSKKFFLPRLAAKVVDELADFVVLIVVAAKIIAGELVIGQLVAVRGLLSQINSSQYFFFRGLIDISSNLIGASDFKEFMETSLPADGDIEVEEIPTIEFRNVSFSYPGSDEKALDDVSFKIGSGESLAIVGENGAGKTTLIKLLIGMYEVDEGEILIGGVPIAKLKQKTWMRQIGALFQNYSRYEFATIGENVWFGDVTRRYDEEEILEAMRRAGVESVVKKTKKGLKQVVSKDLDEESRMDLSGGQWQKLALARSFYRNPNVLILDEPTSAVDAKAEYKIFREIMESQKGKTTIIISHRFSTVRKAERILVLDNGRLVESGTHEELTENKEGLYREMFTLQAEGYL